MNQPTPSWLRRAATLPVAFAQVREDPLLDLWVIDQLPQDARVCMIASGGCTAACVAAAPNVGLLQLVDPNPAQLALARLKLRLLASSATAERLALLGHAPFAAEKRQPRLDEHWTSLRLPADILGPPALVAELGPDHAGRYECVFAELRHALGDQAADIESVLWLDDPTEQARRVDPATPLGRRLDESLDAAMALPHLVRLFGEEATKNPVEPFARHFARRIRHALATLPAARNPYLWQMLRGRYPVDGLAPWLTTPAPARWPTITCVNSFMAEALAATPTTFDFVHLSNILDWLTPAKAETTLQLAAQALRPGGWTLIRQLNSTLEIPSLGPMFDWLTAPADDLHARDRSFFYRAVHLGRKR